MNYCFWPFDKVAEVVTNFVWRKSVQHMTYIVYYKQNVVELNGSVENLGFEKEKIDHQCDEAEKNLRNIEGKITQWIQKVSEFKTIVEAFENDEGHKKAQKPNCFIFPYLWNRHRLGRQAKKMEVDVKKLIDESPEFDEISYQQNVTSNDATLSNAGFVEFGSTKFTMEKVMTQLGDSTVRMIGLYGPGGVGKSTLIKEIARKAKDKKLFDTVVKVDITENPNLQKIQEEIAYVLRLRLEGEGENVRADCLRRRLKKEKGNTLLIMDDLWDKLDLNKLGIPLNDDDDDDDLSNDNKDLNRKALKKEKILLGGCKILLTSRDKRILYDEMDVKSTFCLKELDDNDALMLFQKVARIPNEMSESKQQIVKKYCAGLPMAIVTVAKALKNKSESVWEATLDKLKMQELVGPQISMDISLKLSYDHLENEEIKSIFLLCAQMGHQPLIMDLVKYCFGLGILEGVYSLREARDRINASIQKLKDSGLVLDASSNIHFNMHDMVRDAALSIARKDRNVFVVRNGKLDDWSELDRCTSISICNSDIMIGLSEVINCSQLKFFQIDTKDQNLIIPPSFFKRMKNLRVLMLSGFCLSSLPSSLQCLLKLRMLCLEQCTLCDTDNLSIIGKLKKLRILSFSGSKLKNLPTELGDLDKLQLLDISDCSIVEIIPPNLISSLTCLEELYIRKSLIKMLVEGEIKIGQNSFLSHLKNLHQLKVVDLSIPCVSCFPNDSFFDKLNDYKIVIGDFNMFSGGDFRMPNKYEAFRFLALQLKDGIDIHSQKGLKLLFKRVQILLLEKVDGVQNVVNELNIDGFPDLKHLSIINNNDTKYVNSTQFSNCENVFPNLESLCLYNLGNLETICYGRVTVSWFAKLKYIKVESCYELKNLFSFYADKFPTSTEVFEIDECNCYLNIFLTSLETMEVSDCKSLKEILQIPDKYRKVKFLMLHTLTLQSLPSFTSFYTKVGAKTISVERDKAPPLFDELQVEIPNLQSLNLSLLNIYKIWSDQQSSSFCFQNLIKLVVKDCDKLTYLCSLSMANSLKKLKSLIISECSNMKKIFETGGNSAEKVFIFPKLEEIHLSNMNKLTNIWETEVSVDSFSSLISVHIEKCNKLDKIFPSYMEGWFESLENLIVINCKSVEVIFEIKDSQKIDASSGIDTNLQLIYVYQLPNLKQVWSRDPEGILNFKKLRNISVYYCGELSNLFPASVAKDVQKLENMMVLSCEKMEEIVACEDGSEGSNEALVFPELTCMELNYISNIKNFYKGRHPIKCPKLKKLTMLWCGKLTIFSKETKETSKITNEEEKYVLSTEKVFLNLEYLKIDVNEAEKLLSFKNLIMHHLKELVLISVGSADLLFQFLNRMPNLEKLSLYFSGLHHGLVPITDIAPQEKLGTVLQLKELFLYDSWMRDVGFERDQVLQRLELLSLDDCKALRNLAPPSVSFTYLTYLEVKKCRKLRNLMASSTAKTMLQLKTMKVICCDEVEQIVTIDEGSEEKIVFSKLSTIELVELKNFQSFCSYEKCKFEFPSLEVLIVRGCVKMKTFSEGPSEAPKLENIFFVEGEEKAKWQWEGELNATIEKAFSDKVTFTYNQNLKLDLHNSTELIIKEVWNGSHSVHQNSFRYLKMFTAHRCDALEHVIPSHLFSCFQNLEELKVTSCSEAQVIFNISDEMRVRNYSGIMCLKKLTLRYLPKLKHIWDKDPEGIIGFPVLQEISVLYCKCLKSVFPASVAKDLTRLEELEIKDCKELEEIVWKDEGNAEGEGRTQEFVFSRLSSLTLEGLPRVKYCIQESEEEAEFLESAPSIWPIPNSSFLILTFLTLDGCHFLSDVLIPFNLLPFLTTLERLTVGNCLSLKTIFDVKCTTQDTEMTSLGPSLLFSLKKLTLSNLSNLENVWNEDPHGIISMHHLQEVRVEECKCLTSVFPASVVKDVENLNELDVVVEDCEGLMTIIAEDNRDPSTTNLELTFPCVRSLKLQGLPKFKYFYYSSKLCNIFTDEVDTEKPTSNMQCLSLGQNGLEMISRGELQRNLLHSIKVLILYSCFELDEYIYKVLQQVPNIEKFVVNNGSFKEMFCSNVDCSELLLPLKVLHLESLRELVSLRLNLEASNLTYLKVNECNSLPYLFTSNLVASNLTYLKVQKCSSLRYLLTSSTAKSLSQLKRMEISECDSIEEIVSKEGEESDEDEMIFPQLSCLKLEILFNLRSFYEGSLSLPSLEELSITYCNEMVSLCSGTIKAEKLSHVKLKLKKNPEDIPVKTDLNSTMRREFLRKAATRRKGHLEFRDRADLQEIWRVSVDIPELYFEYLKTLIVDGCKLLSDVLPFNLLPLLPEIETLEVRNCDSVKTIFDVKSTTKDELITFPLKKLVLSKLPNLENIWNEDPHGIVCMNHLQEIDVENCKCLKSVIPASVAKDLVELQNLAVKHCEELMAIVGEDNPADPKGTNLLQLTFPCMKSLTLWDLPKFKYNRIYCIHDATATFQLITPNLQHLILGENELKMIEDGEFQGNHLHKLKVLTLCFHIESDVFPEYAFLQQVPNVGKLVVSSGSFKQIFCLQSPDNVDYRLLLQLKELQLESLGKLVSIGLENSWIEPFVRNLETLQVISCSSLTNLVPGTMSLSNLTHLKVECCNSLLYLFTSSTGKSLAQLKRMEIKLCSSMKEIASEEGDESNEDEEIVFEQLQVLHLEKLDELRCFYPGKFTLRFPSLEEAYVINCDSMKSFSEVNKIPGSTKWYYATPPEEIDPI